MIDKDVEKTVLYLNLSAPVKSCITYCYSITIITVQKYLKSATSFTYCPLRGEIAKYLTKKEQFYQKYRISPENENPCPCNIYRL